MDGEWRGSLYSYKSRNWVKALGLDGFMCCGKGRPKNWSVQGISYDCTFERGLNTWKARTRHLGCHACVQHGRDTGHVLDMAARMSRLFFFLWKMMDTAGHSWDTAWAKKKSWKPKMHLSCRSPPLSSSSSSSCVISSLFFLFFFFLSCDLLPFLSPLMQSLLLLLLIAQARSISPLQFSPFAIFPCFVCVAFFIFSATHWHTREAFISTHPRE